MTDSHDIHEGSGSSPCNFFPSCANICIRWIYELFLVIDADFVKRKKVSSEERSLSLHKGWSYFVEEKDYKEHLAKHRT